MNERIQELCDQACKELADEVNDTDIALEMFPQKFAELIVGQCLSVLETKIDEGEGYGSFESGQHIGLIRARNIIKKHFGVE